MTKSQREKNEQLILKHMIQSTPKLKEILDNLIECPNPELRNMVRPVIEQELKNHV